MQSQFSLILAYGCSNEARLNKYKSENYKSIRINFGIKIKLHKHMSNMLPLLKAHLSTAHQTKTTQREQKNFKNELGIENRYPMQVSKKVNCTFVLIESSTSRTFWRAGLASPTYRKTQRTRQHIQLALHPFLIRAALRYNFSKW